jgi:hypothetical protein
VQCKIFSINWKDWKKKSPQKNSLAHLKRAFFTKLRKTTLSKVQKGFDTIWNLAFQSKGSFSVEKSLYLKKSNSLAQLLRMAVTGKQSVAGQHT